MALISNNNYKLTVTPATEAHFSFDGTMLALAKEIFQEMQQSPQTQMVSRNTDQKTGSKIAYLFTDLLCAEFRKEIPERELLRKIHQLYVLLDKLDQFRDPKITRPVNYWRSMDPELFSLLCEGVWYACAQGAEKRDDRFGEHAIEKNPYILLKAITPDGDNLIKKLIFELEELGKMHQCSDLTEGGHLSCDKLRAAVQERMKSWGPTMTVRQTRESEITSLGFDEDISTIQAYLFETIQIAIQNLKLTNQEKILLAQSFIQKKAQISLLEEIDFSKLSQKECVDLIDKLIQMEVFVADFIEKFKLPQALLSKFIHVCFQKAPEAIADNLKKFELSQEEQIVLLHCLIEKKAFQTIAENIHQFDLPGFILHDVTQRCLANDPILVARNVTHFRLLTPQQRFQLAERSLAEENILEFSSRVRQFGLTEEERHQIALKYVQTHKHQLPKLAEFELTQLHQNEIILTYVGKISLFSLEINFARSILTEENQFKFVQSCIKSYDFTSLDSLKILFKMIEKLNLNNVDLRHSLFRTCCEHPSITHFLLSNLTTWSIDFSIIYCQTAFPKMGFEQDIDEILKIKDTHAQQKTLTWYMHSLFKLKSQLTDEQLFVLKKQRFMQKLIHLTLPDIRPHLLNAIVQVITKSNLPLIKENSNEISDPLLAERKELLLTFYYLFVQQGVREQTVRILFEQINSRYFIQNILNFRTVILALSKLANQAEFTPNEKEHILSQLYERSLVPVKSKKGAISYQKDNGSMIRSLTALTTILEFQELTALKNIQQFFPSLLEEIIKKYLPIGDIPNYMERYENTFGKSRYPEGLFTFAGKMKEAGQVHLNCLGMLTRAVLIGQYPACRYDTSNNPHLSKMSAEMLEKWKTPIPLLKMNLAQDDKQINPLNWLKQSLIQQQHLPLDQFPYLKDFIWNTAEENRQKLLGQINEVLAQNTNDQKLQIQRECLELVNPQDHNLVGHLNCLQNLLLNTNYEFIYNVNGYLVQQNKIQTLSEVFTIVDTDEFDVVFNIGKVDGESCQRWNGTPHLCCGLLGTLMHGQTRILAVIDQEGKIHSRALLRILLNAQNEPVLFLEPVYPQLAPRSHVNALLTIAKEKAAKLGIDLTVNLWAENKNLKAYPTSVHSEGGPAPSEYCDAMAGLQPEGKFTIENVFYIN